MRRVQKKNFKLKEGIDINYKPISLKQFPCSFSLFPLSVLASPHAYCIWVQSNCSNLLITALNVRSNREYQQSGTISAETPLSYVELRESYRNSLCFISWAQYLSLLLVICNVWEITKVFAPLLSVNSTAFLGGRSHSWSTWWGGTAPTLGSGRRRRTQGWAFRALYLLDLVIGLGWTDYPIPAKQSRLDSQMFLRRVGKGMLCVGVGDGTPLLVTRKVPRGEWRQHRGKGNREKRERGVLWADIFLYIFFFVVSFCLNKFKLGFCNLQLEGSWVMSGSNLHGPCTLLLDMLRTQDPDWSFFDTLFRTVFVQSNLRDEVISSIKSTLVSECYKGGESSKLSVPFLNHHLPRLQTFIWSNCVCWGAWEWTQEKRHKPTECSYFPGCDG